MKIVINTRLLLSNHLEGIGWFTFENFRRIVKNHAEHEFYFLFDRKYDPEFIFSENVKPLVISPQTRHPLLWYAWFEYSVPKVINKIKPDIFISPDGYLSLTLDIPQLAVIHDINFHHRPLDLPYSSRLYYRYFFPKFAQKAKRIVTVSEFSKEDISKSYNVPADKIDVIYNGAQELYKPLPEEEKKGAKARYSMGYDYFIFIGAQHPRKNIDGLLRAFDQFKSIYQTDHKLIIVGEKKFLTNSIEDTYRQMNFKSEVLFTGRLSCEEIALVLGSATALVFIPFFEGFGIPLVEAMYCDVPIISANTTSLPEVAGNAALYIDPDNTREITEAMYSISTDKALQKKLIENSRIIRNKYNWDISADKLWNSIEKCLH